MRSEITPGGQKVRSFIEEARRRQIVAFTIETLAEAGFAHTSLAEIAKRAGISKGVISYHFSGKRELIEQVIEQVQADEALFMQLVKQREDTAAGKLRFYIQSHFDFVKTERKLLRALMEIFHNVRKPDGTQLYESSTYERRLELLEAILREGQEQGEFLDFNPRVMAISLRAALDALPLQLNLHPDLDIDSYSAEVIALFDRATRRQRPAENPQEVSIA